MNIGALSEALFSGVTDTSTLPDAPCLSTSGSAFGATGDSDTEKLGVEAAIP